MLVANRIYQVLGGLALTCMVTFGKAQAPSNKPTTQNQPSAPTLTVNPTPSAYPSNFKINFVRTKTAVYPIADENTFNSEEWIGNSFSNKVLESTEYFDGLGRTIQKVERGVIPSYFDALLYDRVTPIIYDELGREKYRYEPTQGGHYGKFHNSPFLGSANFYNSYLRDYTYPQVPQTEQVFYSQTEYEASPLNRVLKVMPPGNSWAGSGRGTSYQYLINTAADSVRIWNITNNSLTYSNGDETTNVPTSTAQYVAGELYKNVTIDEDTNAVVEYKDKEGKLILKKVQIGTTVPSDFSGYEGWLCTYYVYDDFGQMRFVISPKAVASIKANWVIGTEVVKELCFRYEFDDRNRMIAKKVPGAGWVYMVYDKRDRLVFTQDANMRLNNHWLTNLYDELNRPVMTGMITYTDSRQALQDYINQQVSGVFTIEAAIPQQGALYVSERDPEQDTYTAAESISFTEFESESDAEFTAEITSATTTEAVPVTGPSLPPFNNFIALTITYYDNYEWNENDDKQFTNADNAKLNTATISPARYLDNVPDVHSAINTGSITGTRTRILEDPADLSKGGWLTTVSYYDDKARVIQTQSDNYKGGVDITTNRYDLKGLLHVTYLVHHNPAAGNQRTRTRRIFGYTNHDLLVSEKFQLNDDGVDRLIATKAYDNIGRLMWNHKPGAQIIYKYNIRGWLIGINSYNIDPALTPWYGQYNSDQLWFSEQLLYDYGFEQNQYNGNIAGMKWKSKGDGEIRSYGFGYDGANRLLHADFNQQFGTTWAKTDPGNSNFTIDFSAQMGDGVNPATAYDENGNIKAMKQWGLKVNSSDVIDDLNYGYYPNSNKLQNVIDNQNDVQTKLGDFRSSPQYMNHLGTKTNEAMDYQYDQNGNMVMDLNKDIFLQNGEGTYENPANGIIYNHLNLPWKVGVHAKGNITYIYDALGNKLEKRVQEFGKPEPNTTTYISGFQYENDSLQFLGHEEGRVRYSKKYFLNGDSAKMFFYDYFLKDHLGNIRMVLTEQRDTAQYVATMETAYRAKEEKLFYNIPETEYPVSAVSGGYPVDTTVTNPNQFISRLNGNGPKVGPSLVLKVMSGDKIDIAVKSFYRAQANPGENHDPLQDLLNVLASGIVGAVGESKGTQANLSNFSNSPLLPALNSFRNANNPDPSGKPKAYLNWILLDEQFRYVSSYPQSGAIPVGNADQLNTLAHNGISIAKNGYLYIYVSNETENWDVFFDNLSVQHKTGPLMEETHYYPFGLTMAGISSRAFKPEYSENKKKYNGIEYDSTFGIDIYAAELRYLDPQIGRWWEIDPKIESMEMWSPYASNYDNPIRYNDPRGDEGQMCCKGLIDGIKEFVKDVKDAAVETGEAIYTHAVNGARWVNTNFNLLTPVVEGVTGRSVESNFTASKPRMDAVAEGIVTFAIPGSRGPLNLIKAEARAVASSATKSTVKAVEKYEVGTFDDLGKRSVSGDDLAIHHAPQKHPAAQQIVGYDKRTAPSIALPTLEHRVIPVSKGTTTLTARQQLAKDIRDLRKYTEAPLKSLQSLIDLTKQMFPKSFEKLK